MKRNAMRVLRRVGDRPWWILVTRHVVERGLEEGWLIIAIAAFVGAGAGYAIVGFYSFVGLMHALSEFVGSRLGVPPGSRWLPFATIPLGLLLARWLMRWGTGRIDGEMVPDLMRAAALRGGATPVRAMFVKVVSAGLTLGAGGSLGSEGPVAVAGATIGSGLGQAFRFGPNRLKVLLACGAAAGISAAFNAPIAGVLFALEVVLGTFAVTALSPVLVASVMGTVVARAHLGSHPAFDVPAQFSVNSFPELGFFVLLGFAGGALAAGFVLLFYRAQDLLASVAGNSPAAAVVAGILVACAGLFSPELLGPGRHGIRLVLFGQLTGWTVVALVGIKIVVSGLTMGGGGAGGVFTPSLFVGAGLGSSFGAAIQQLFPALSVSPAAYALVGMAALVAGVLHAPLTAILVVVEMTGDYGLVLPLMLVCVISYLLSKRLHGESIYSESLVRNGEHVKQGTDRSVLENVQVAECFNRDPDVIAEDAPLTGILNLLKRSRQTDFPVINRDLELAGMLNHQQLSLAMGEEGLKDLVVAADLALADVETACPADSLLDAMRKMGVRDLDYLPVVESPGSHRLVGLVGRRDIMEAYRTHLLLQH